jgi:hypothetical protein
VRETRASREVSMSITELEEGKTIGRGKIGVARDEGLWRRAGVGGSEYIKS